MNTGMAQTIRFVNALQSMDEKFSNELAMVRRRTSQPHNHGPLFARTSKMIGMAKEMGMGMGMEMEMVSSIAKVLDAMVGTISVLSDLGLDFEHEHEEVNGEELSWNHQCECECECEDVCVEMVLRMQENVHTLDMTHLLEVQQPTPQHTQFHPQLLQLPPIFLPEIIHQYNT